MLGAAGALLYEDPDAYTKLQGLQGGGVSKVVVAAMRPGAGAVEKMSDALDDEGELRDALEALAGGGEFISVSPGPGLGAVGAEALGSLTGAPPQTDLYERQVAPSASGATPVRVVDNARASRVATFTAPSVGFSIFVGGSGVQPGQGTRLPPGLPYDMVIPGFQELFAVTDAPVFLPLQVQVAPLLIGDRERRY
jgi:hypothetical protein